MPSDCRGRLAISLFAYLFKYCTSYIINNVNKTIVILPYTLFLPTVDVSNSLNIINDNKAQNKYHPHPNTFRVTNVDATTIKPVKIVVVRNAVLKRLEFILYIGCNEDDIQNINNNHTT
jgi:hypothetical protein